MAIMSCFHPVNLLQSMAWIVVVTLLTGLLMLFERILSTSHENSEPPLIPQPFPIIGHIVGMIRYGSHYYTKVRIYSERTKLPIYTLGIPGGKIYVVASSHLVSQVDRNAKTISFAPFVVLFLQRIVAPSRKAIEALSENIEGDGLWGFRQETLRSLQSNISLEENLESITHGMLQSLVPQLSRPTDTSSYQKLRLFAWMRKVVTRASTDAIYGRESPFHDPQVEESFWSVDSNFALLGLNICPRWFARRGVRGREKLAEAFFQYYTRNSHNSASSLVRARYEVDRKHGISVQDTARFDLSICMGLLVNVVPATFWSLYFIYQRPALLEELRIGLSEYIVTHYDKSDHMSHIVDFAKILACYPLLSGCIREALRVLSKNASGRVLLKDTLLDGQHLLKKNSILLIPSAELHNDPAMWGSDYEHFNPRRWLHENRVKAPASAYRAFGGGSWPCPGRHFSMNEMAAVLVMIILQYDLFPSGGSWKHINTAFHLSTSVLTPQNDVEVEIKTRKGYENIDWNFQWKGVTI